MQNSIHEEGRWFSDVLILLLRGRPNWTVAIGAFAVTFAAVSVLFVGSFATLSPNQYATQYMGAADASISPPIESGSISPGESPKHPAWAPLIQHLSVVSEEVLSADIPVPLEGEQRWEQALYYESSWPLHAWEGRLSLTSGDPPRQPRECVRSATVSLDSTLPGGAPLHFVGTINPTFQPTSPTVVCAPGTWASWEVPTQYKNLSRYEANVTTYLTGEDTLLALSRLGQPGVLAPTASVESRQDLVSLHSTLSPQKFMATWSPLLGLPLGAGIILGGSFGAWAARTSHLLHSLGFPRRRLSIASLASVTASTMTASALGILLSYLAMPAWRWTASLFAQGGQLGESPPYSLLLGWVALLTTLGSCSGCSLGLLLLGRRRSVAARTLTSLSLPQRKVLATLAASLAAAAALTVANSDGKTAFMIGGALLGSVALGCASAVALPATARWLEHSETFSRRLAGRLLNDDSRRWSLTTMSITIFVGIIATSFVYMTSSAAAELTLMGSRVPERVAALRIQDPEGDRVPAEAIAEFETTVEALTSPTLIREQRYWEKGPIWEFSSLSDLEKITGPLQPTIRAQVLGGSILSPEVARPTVSEVVTFTANPAEQLGFIPFSGGLVRGFGHPSAYALESALPLLKNPGPVEYLLYFDVDTHLTEKAKSWPLARGLTGVEVLVYSGEAKAFWPLWTTISLAGFSLVVLIVVSVTARREVESLHPLLGALAAFGLPRGWNRGVVLSLLLTMTILCASLALLGSLFSLSLLSLSYGTVFDALGVPWWLLVIFLLLLPATGALSAMLLTRKQGTPTLTHVDGS